MCGVLTKGRNFFFFFFYVVLSHLFNRHNHHCCWHFRPMHQTFFFLSPFFRSCLLFVKSVIVRTQTSRHSVPIVIFFFLLTFFPPCQRRGFPFFFYQFLFYRPVWIPKTGNQTSNIRGTVINVSLFNFCFISKLLATIHLCVVSVILSFSIDYASSCM